MKNIYKFIIFFAISCNVATDACGNRPNYLTDAANAWTALLGDYGRSSDIATRMRNAQTTNMPAFLNMVNVIAYNDTALNLYQITNHLNRALNFIRTPDIGRRPSGKSLLITPGAFAEFTDYDANYNSDFKTHTFGAFVRASGYVSDGFSLGIGYTNSHADTRHTPVDTDAESNSITIFTEYLDKNGFFLNMGLNGGTTRWEIDKTIAGIPDDSTYNTDFYAGQIAMGIQMNRASFLITPHAGVRYTRITADSHSDAAAQRYEKWWYNLLTANAGVKMGYSMIAGGAVITPYIHAGATYDAISNGTDDIRVVLISGQAYDVPVDVPDRAAFSGGLGISVHTKNITVDAKYELDARSDYTSHMGKINASFAF